MKRTLLLTTVFCCAWTFPAKSSSDFDLLADTVYKLALKVHHQQEEINLLKKQVRLLQDRLSRVSSVNTERKISVEVVPKKECKRERSFVVATFVKPDSERIWHFLEEVKKKFGLVPRVAVSRKKKYVVVAVKTDRETAKKIAEDAFYSRHYDYDHMIEVDSPYDLKTLLASVLSGDKS